jgi:YesN/AraC family two-component response regulator
VISGILKNEYEILTAASGSSAVQLAREQNGEIHLLLSDFDMPGLSGIDLATALTIDRPEIRVLLMSAIGGGILELNEGWYFLAKPG